MIVYIKDATDKEVESFLSNSFIVCKNDFNKEKVSKPNRKRIAMTMEIMNSLNIDHGNFIEYTDYINDYYGDSLKFDSCSYKFEISTDDELKNLICGLQQRFYTIPISHEKRLANSIIKL